MISILIPFNNEVENISNYNETLFPVIKDVMIRYGEQYEYVFIDDGSTDKSFDICVEVSKTDDHVSIIASHEPKSGLGIALRRGFDECKGDYIIVMDADLSYRPEDIKILLRKWFENPDADCISGSPYTKNFKDNSVRIFGSRFFNKRFSKLLKGKVTCVTGMFRFYKTSTLRELELTSKGFNINTEIILKLIANGKNVYEVPVKLYKRDFGKSKMKVFKEVRNETKILLKLKFKKMFGKRLTI
jgi:dolichol-phosphate mannosyltransferase